jgi:uncharacterized lipoprotein YmbA
MRTTFTFAGAAALFALLLSGCASSSHNTNSYQSPNDREINKAIDEEVNSLSKKDIEQLNKLK